VVSLSQQDAWSVLAGIPDPEIPAISITDLGIVRDVVCANGHVDVTVTPTYSGCPATEMIQRDIVSALQAAGADEVAVHLQLSPAWTTDWLGEDARARLAAYGIAPPQTLAPDAARPLVFRPRIRCPRCGSTHSEQLSAFGATACKALYRCLDCREPFEYFKPI
jgi:ring-1,2-phenylacetyl-CoA epoxidase subunit PaaD